MKKYFYTNDDEKHGPFTFDELKNEEINSSTLIWFEGLDNWTNAKYILELKEILELSPPPLSITFDEEPTVLNTIENPQENELPENLINNTQNHNQGMFSSIFSFDGRIRRTEYGISIIIYAVIVSFMNASIGPENASIISVLFIPLLWFLWGQGAKRCHDIGQSGWFQIIPFYGFWMIFKDGKSGNNKYGLNPKA